MAAIITNKGLQVMLDRAYALSGPPSQWQTMAVDDQSGSFAASHDQLNDVGTVTNEADRALDNASRTAQTVTVDTTFGTSEANFTIRRISLHNAAPASVSASTTTLMAGVDGQSITKNSDFTLKIELQHTSTDAS